MDYSKAIEVAEKTPEVKALQKEGFFLSSLFANIHSLDKEVDEWILHFFNPEKKTVVDCFANAEGVEMGEETPALSDMKEFAFTHIIVGFDKAKEKVAGKSLKPVSILVTLSRKGNMTWTFNFVNVDFSVLTVEVDALSGNITKEETSSLARRL